MTAPLQESLIHFPMQKRLEFLYWLTSKEDQCFILWYICFLYYYCWITFTVKKSIALPHYYSYMALYDSFSGIFMQVVHLFLLLKGVFLVQELANPSPHYAFPWHAWNSLQ